MLVGDRHDANSLDDLLFLKLQLQLLEKHATNALIEKVRAEQSDITVISTEPLDKLVAALRREPRLARMCVPDTITPCAK